MTLLPLTGLRPLSQMVETPEAQKDSTERTVSKNLHNVGQKLYYEGLVGYFQGGWNGKYLISCSVGGAVKISIHTHTTITHYDPYLGISRKMLASRDKAVTLVGFSRLFKTGDAIIKSEIYYYFLHKYRGRGKLYNSDLPSLYSVISTWPSVSNLPEFVRPTRCSY